MTVFAPGFRSERERAMQLVAIAVRHAPEIGHVEADDEIGLRDQRRAPRLL